MLLTIFAKKLHKTNGFLVFSGGIKWEKLLTIFTKKLHHRELTGFRWVLNIPLPFIPRHPVTAE